MRFRLELFVADVDASVRFYSGALGFRVERHEGDYVHLRRGDAELGLAAVARLPDRDPAGGFTRESVSRGRGRGVGVEIVLEVEDLALAARDVEAAGYALAEAPQDRPWGLRDFRVIDPDGYYVRVTTGSTDRSSEADAGEVRQQAQRRACAERPEH